MSRRNALRDRFNWIAFFALLILLGVSLLTQRNADFYSGKDFYSQQVVWILVGFLFFFLPAAVVDLRLVERAAYPVLALSVVLLVLTALFGTEVNHSRRWLRWGVNIQASELAKLGVILALARRYHARHEHLPGEPPPPDRPLGFRDLLVPAGLLLAPALLILTQPDLGTTLLMVFVGIVITLYERVNRRVLVTLTLVGLVGVPVGWKFGVKQYQKARFLGLVDSDWERIDADAAVVHRNRHTQSEQAIWAISSGEFWGRGSRGASKERLRYLPEMHSDMISAPFAEEHGFLGCTGLLLLFWLLVVWGLRTAKDARDRFCQHLAVGVSAMIGLQVFINLAMVAGILPIVGLPLPFLSYGGSAAMVYLASLGLVFNVALRRGRM